MNVLRVIRIDVIKHRSWTLDLSQPVVKHINKELTFVHFYMPRKDSLDNGPRNRLNL